MGGGEESNTRGVGGRSIETLGSPETVLHKPVNPSVNCEETLHKDIGD